MTLVGLLLGLQAVEPLPGRWEGFAPGSWVVLGHRPIAEPFLRLGATGRTEILSLGADDRPTLRTDGEAASTAPRLPETDRRRDTLSVGGRTLTCTVIEYLGDAGAATAWAADGVRLPAREMAALPLRVAAPPDVVRVDARYVQTGAALRATLELSDLSSTLDVAGRRIACVLETEAAISEMPSGARILRSYRRWLSDEVPGRIVRQDRLCSSNPAGDPPRCTTRDEILDFFSAGR